ncbi:NAD-dependent epimerase/dehydratase family protein [Dactylosporangium sp. NPDC051541]|uniref:NAD-dependent epimerase/dehydratase family protein n=1 Tax=Dactylosporangium sp. NPDC051541 TaxID=3363977 RepID=UPI0037AFEA86
MKRVVLFGGSGFIGGHVRAVLEADARCVVVAPGRDRHDLQRDGVAALCALLAEESPDAVVNCTGRLGGTAAELLQANAIVTARLLEAVAAAAPAARLVRLGSAAEYGPVPAGVAVTEAYPAAPVSDYGVSQLAGTRLAELAAREGRVDAVVLRVFNPIGPGLHADNMLGRAAALMRAAAAGGADAITLGPLGAHRDFLDIGDVARAVQRAVFVTDPPARVLNVASGQAVVSRTAVRLLAEAAGFAGVVREEGVAPSRSTAVPWMCGDIAAARAALGWTPEVTLADAVKRVWAGVG